MHLWMLLAICISCATTNSFKHFYVIVQANPHILQVLNDTLFYIYIFMCVYEYVHNQCSKSWESKIFSWCLRLIFFPQLTSPLKEKSMFLLIIAFMPIYLFTGNCGLFFLCLTSNNGSNMSEVYQIETVLN
ncbi:hypothetical protein HanIR_Chr10g0465741 [Helianthus annuus]|nr:hypothetical protein HanIR_Chr10g0465741 [Helianthus annuus]